MPHGPRFEKLTAEAKSNVEEVTAGQALEEQARGAVLIDVRERDEFDKEHATGAIHLGKGVVEMKIEQEVPDAAARIVCYCGGGNRSALVVENLKRMGYQNAASLAGGFKAWKAAELPTTH